MEKNIKYKYLSKEEYSKINKEEVSKRQKEHESKQNYIYYEVNVDYYDEYEMYYLTIPNEYLNQIEDLRKRKEDIFAKGKILTFTTKNNDFSFDAVIDSTEEEIYAYLVPIKEKYRYNYNLVGKYFVNERLGDLTYIRMKDAINEFIEGYSCSNHLEKYILGEDMSQYENKQLKQIFNFNIYYDTYIPKYGGLSEVQIENIFYNEMNTIDLKSNINKNNTKLICLIIYVIYQVRKNFRDKILICSSSNSVADSISLELLKMNDYIYYPLNILRIYAKNQEIVKRNKKLNSISLHKLMTKRLKRKFIDRNEKKNWIIRRNDIIVSTCVNSYNDDIINYKFPFVIIIDANNSNENENLIPITLKAKHVILISYKENNSEETNLYKRMKHLYPENHINI